MNDIDYKVLLENLNHMINLLEYDAMRGSGKMKLNSQHLHALYYLKELYEAKVVSEEKLKKEDK